MSITANHLNNVIFRLMSVWLNGTVFEPALYSPKMIQESINCFFLSKTSVQINLLIKKFRAWIDDSEGIELLFKCFNRTFDRFELLKVKECKSWVVSPLKCLNSFFFPLVQISFLNEEWLYQQCNLKVFFVVRIVLAPIWLHYNVDNILVPEVILEFIFVGDSELKVFFSLFLPPLILIIFDLFIYYVGISLWTFPLTFVIFRFWIFLGICTHSCWVWICWDEYRNFHVQRPYSFFSFLLLSVVLWHSCVFLFCVQTFLFSLLRRLILLYHNTDPLPIKLLAMHTSDGIFSWGLEFVLNEPESLAWAICVGLQ